MIQALSRVRQSSSAELQAFDATCESLGGFDPDISAEWVDGFLAALAAGPTLLEPLEWLPLMCGDAFERAFADPQSAQAAQRSLLVRLKVLRDQLDPAALMDDPQALRLDPLINEWTEADRERLVQEAGVPADAAEHMYTGGVWAYGFLDAVERQPEIWMSPAQGEAIEAVATLLSQVAAITYVPGTPQYLEHISTYYAKGDPKGDPKGEPKGEPTRDELLAEACWAVQELRVFWTDHAPKPATRQVGAKVGRNDPCPCGGGKKFKKCHGAAA